MKVFSERYGFQLSMTSKRCRFLEKEGAVCSGDVETCPYCESREDCLNSGGSTFTVFFPRVGEAAKE